MANYDFQNILSPLDFEYLTRDLLSADLKIELTAFAEGKDGGVDLRYSENKKSSIVVQCKRSKNITKSLLEEEAKKLKKLKFDKYYFVVSCNLSVKKVDQIKDLFKDWIEGDKNIYSRQRLNQLLDKYPEIQRKHYKLWLNSSKVFNVIINQHLFERSKALISSIQKSYKYYVKNNSIKVALDILNRHQFLIISGIPGIGKTTLAKLLLWEYLQKDYEIIEIRKILEGEQILTEESKSKQVFYFDDFLGENFLKYDVIEGRSYDLVQFINRVMSNKNKILIMTTREYILTQAKEKYAKLDTDELNIHKYTLDLNTYTKRIRTLILYNHLYYSDVSLEHIKELINNKVYKKIINHKNYSPRIIEQMTIKLAETEPDKYANSFLENLNNPFGIWDRAFKAEISEGAKYTLFILLSIGRPIFISEIKEALDFFYETIALKQGINFRPIDYRDYIKELEDCFIKTNLTDEGTHFIDFQNPSIKDFLLELIKPDKDLLIALIESSFYFNQFAYTVNYLCERFRKDNKLNKIIYKHLTSRYDEFKNTYTIFYGLELRETLKEIDKIDSLKNYLKESKNALMEDFVIKKFESIDSKKLFHHDEKKYLSFFKDFKDKIKIGFNDLFSSTLANIDWFGNVKNFLILKEISTDFDNLVKSNQIEIDNKISNAINKEIEYKDSKSSLENLISELDEEIDNIGAFSKVDFHSFTQDIQDKIESIDNEVDETSEKETVETDDFIETKKESEDKFNEEEYFNIEMFE